MSLKKISNPVGGENEFGNTENPYKKLGPLKASLVKKNMSNQNQRENAVTHPPRNRFTENSEYFSYLTPPGKNEHGRSL